MKALLHSLIFLMLSGLSITVKAQNDVDSDIPTCIPNMLWKNVFDLEFVCFLQNPQFTVKKVFTPYKHYNPRLKSILHWEAEGPDYSFIQRTGLSGSEKMIGSLKFTANSKEASNRCFKSLLAMWGLTSDPKANKAIMKDRYYLDNDVKKEGKMLHVTFRHYIDNKYGNLSYLVYLTWNLSDKKNPWLQEVAFNDRRDGLGAESCFESKPLRLSRSQLDLDDSKTYFRALGMTLTDADKKAFFFHKRAWVDQDTMIISEDGVYAFKIVKEGKNSRVSSVIYDHSISNYMDSPIGGGNKILVTKVNQRFGDNYYRMDGIQIFARDPANPRKSSFYFDLELKSSVVSKVTVKAEDFENFDNDMHLKLDDMLFSKKCFDGSCFNKIGSKYFSDGYLFIGEWRDGNPDFGPIYNRDMKVVRMIDNRITPEQAKAKEIAKKNNDTEKMQAAVDGMHGTISAYADNWNLYIKTMVEYFDIYRGKKGDMVETIKSALRLIERCQKNCDDIVNKSKYLVKYFHDYNFCKEASPLLIKMEQNAVELHKITYDEMMRMNRYSSVSDQKKEIMKIEAKMNSLHVALQDDYKLVIEKFNACVQAHNEKN